jgi:NTE family protein
VHRIKNLVFEGGGTKGSAYAGCLEILEQHQLYTPIERVAGTSAGSITACLLACGAMPEGLKQSVYNTPFKRFVDDKGGIFGDVYRMLFKYGIHTGDPLVKILKQHIQMYCGDAEINFTQLTKKSEEEPKRFKKLYVIASDLLTQRAKVFCEENTPNLPVWKAVRASVSLPFIFEPYQIDDEYFVDGGLSWVYPIDVFDHTIEAYRPSIELSADQFNQETLGFYLESKKQFKYGGSFNTDKIEVKSLSSYAEALATFMLQTSNAEHLRPCDKQRTVFINDLGVSGTTFNTSKQVIDQLVQSGREATEGYLKKWKRVA